MTQFIKYAVLLLSLTFISIITNGQTIELDEEHWFRKGPYCAYVQSLAMAPSNPDVLYAGTYADGVYKTTNGGEIWTRCSVENLPMYGDTIFLGASPSMLYGNHHTIHDIAVDPQDAKHVWISAWERGLYQSTNGGDSWQKADTTLPDSLSVNFIHINPENPEDILLGAGKEYSSEAPDLGGLYRTTNGGASWSLIEEIPHGATYFMTGITRDPTNNEHIVVGVNSAGEPGFSWGIMESYDNGNSWQEVTKNDNPVYDISINPDNNLEWWGAVYTGYLDWWLESTENTGQNWEHYQGFEDPYKWVTSLYADADFNLYIEREADTTYPAYSILKSPDKGESWYAIDKLSKKKQSGRRSMSLRNRTQTQPDNPDNLYIGNLYGLFHSENGGETTHLQNNKIPNSYIYDLEVNPFDKDTVYAAGFQGLWRTNNGGNDWQRIVINPVGFTKFDPQTPDTLYYGGVELNRSFDDGKTFQKITGPIAGALINMAIHPDSTNILFVHSSTDTYSHLVYKSTDYGNHWDLVFNSGYNEGVSQVIIDPHHPDTVYFSTHRSYDQGKTWHKDALEFKVLGIHPFNSAILYGTDYYEKEVWVSDNYGKTFQFIHEFDGKGIIHKFKISQEQPNWLFYATIMDGVHYSTNAGETWHQLVGPYEKRIREVTPLVNEKKYYIASYGDGVWVYDTTYHIGIDEEPVVNDESHLNVAPNPVKNQTSITFNMKHSGFVNLAVYDMKGDVVKTLLNRNIKKGGHELIWYGKDQNGKEVKTGLYLVRLIINSEQAGRNVQVRKIVLLK